MTAAALAALIARCGFVLLFLPFSALDKILSFAHARTQAQKVFMPRSLAAIVVLIGVAIEIICSLGVVTGIADRIAAFIIACYCAATAILFKRFWDHDGFWSEPGGKARMVFWDFLKNLSLGAGFLLIVVGTDGAGLIPFVNAPFASSHPYAQRSTS